MTFKTIPQLAVFGFGGN